MAVLPATTGRLNNRQETGIRPFDIGRDLRPVAELIADAFASELDSRGNAALREMRVMSHIGGFLRLLNHNTGEFDDFFGGFIWMEAGKVVGNVTVQRAEQSGNRWHIANLAVLPAWRGQGISRRLMARALEHIAENSGQWAVLQVYARNNVARSLYRQLEFEEVDGTVDLRLDRIPRLEAATGVANFYSFSSGQWQALYELAAKQLGSAAQWWRPLRRTHFQVTFEQQIGEWFWRNVGHSKVFRRSIQNTQRFDAALVLTAQRWRGDHQLQLWARPEYYGQHEQALLHWALSVLQEYPRWPVQLSLNVEHKAAFTAAQSFGFREQQTLLTLRRKI